MHDLSLNHIDQIIHDINRQEITFSHLREDLIDHVWAEKIFQNNNLAWSLIYLDGLETNLSMIRASVK